MSNSKEVVFEKHSKNKMTAETACKSRFYEGYKKIFLITEKNISLKLSFFKNYSIEDRRGRFIG